MNYFEIINSIALVALTIAYFIQNNQLKFMKTIIDSYQPEKLKQAQEFIEQGRKHEFNLILSKQTRELVSKSSKEFQETHKTLLDQYNECLNRVIPFLMDKTWEEREAFLKNWPKNAETIKSLLRDYDNGLLTDSEK